MELLAAILIFFVAFAALAAIGWMLVNEFNRQLDMLLREFQEMYVFGAVVGC